MKTKTLDEVIEELALLGHERAPRKVLAGLPREDKASILLALAWEEVSGE